MHEASAHARAGQTIQDDVADLARTTLDHQLSGIPEMRAYFSGDRYNRSLDDTVYHLTALAQALVIEEPTLLLEYVTWAKIVLVSRGLQDEHLAGSLVAIRDTLAGALDDGLSAAAAEYIDASLEALADASGTMLQAMEPDAPYADVARDYLDALLGGDRDAAATAVDDALDAGAALPELYEHVFRATQHEIGRLWQSNRVSVAIEHYATGATEAIMLERCAGGPRNRVGARVFLGACVEGEQHDLAIRMVCDVLQSDGWKVSFLGASTPESGLLEAVERLQPTVVGLSTSSFFHIDKTRKAIKAIHDLHPNVKIVVGGGPFDRIDGLAEKVGADARGGELLGLAARFALMVAQGDGTVPDSTSH